MRKLRNLIALTAISALCWVSFYNSIENEFVFDDDLAIVRNADVLATTPWSNIWKNDIWGKHLLAHDSHRSYRPLLICIFKFIQVWFGLTPSAFRIVSIFFHNLFCITLYFVADGIFKNSSLAFTTSVLFASHPIHVESVAAVVNMAEAMSGVFYLLVFHMFTRSLSARNPASHQILGFVFLSISILFKETGVTVCGLILVEVAVLLFKFYRTHRFLGQQSSSFLRPLLLWLQKFWTWIIYCLSGVLGYVLFRLVLVGMDSTEVLLSVITLNYSRFLGAFSKAYLGESQLIRRAENPYAFLETRTEKILSYMHLHYRYFALLVYPKDQCAEYAYDCIPKVVSLEDERNKYSFGLYIGLIILALIGLSQVLIFSKGVALPVKQNIEDSSSGDQGAEMKEDSIEKSNDLDRQKYELHSEVDEGISAPCLINLSPCTNEPFWKIDSGALLSSLAWLCVPFIPMSGAVLKLGTLLAERLLYIPSVGWCMLLATILHGSVGLCYSLMVCLKEIIWRRPSERSPEDTILTEFQVLPRFGLLIIVSLICYQYSTMTAEYNKHWKNSETLFVHGLKVCPRSAKLNLQVAKIHVNRGEYSKGKVYVDRAAVIDPEFCDIGYQYALIALFYDEDIDEAMSLAADNLGCPFSSVGSLELLNKLMDLQLSQSPRNHKVIARHGDLSVKGGMSSMAIQKYQAAVTLAFEAGAFKEAIGYSVKAENCLAGLVDDSATNLASWQAKRVALAKQEGSYELHYNQGLNGIETPMQRLGRDHVCYVDMLGGGVRAHIDYQINNEKKGKKSAKLGKTEKFQLSRKKELLFRAIQPSCVVFDSVSGRLQSAHAEKALSLLSNVMVSDFNEKTKGKRPEEYDIGVVEEFAKYGYTASQVYLLLANVTALPINADGGENFLKTNKEGKFNQQEMVVSYKTKAVEVAQTTVNMWAHAGKLHFYNKAYGNATNLFSLGLQWGLSGEDDGALIGASCALLYWKSHSIAAREEFLNNKEEAEEIISLLDKFIDCKDKDGPPAPSILKQAKAQIAKLKTLIMN